jgi:hypothetical protein
MKREGGQAIKQVLPEKFLVNPFFERHVGRGDHSNIQRYLLIAADSDDCSLLQETQEMSLLFEREISDLVEEDRPAVGMFEQADPA